MEYYKQHMDEDIETLKKMIQEAKQAGVKFKEETLTLNQLLSLINKRTVPIIILDWNIIANNKYKGFMGHYVALCGFDNKFVYINNSSGKNGRRLQSIPRRIFDKARRSQGTDENILIISKPPKKENIYK